VSTFLAPMNLTTVPARRFRLSIFILICCGLTACNSVLFFPGKIWVQTPDQLGLTYKDVALIAEDGVKLSAWWLAAEAEVKGSVLFLHGNAENISTHIHSVAWLPAQGYQVLLLDYRGYGRSEGQPALPDVFMDIEAALTWLTNAPETQGKPRIVLGQSLGASMGGYVVGRQSASTVWSRQLDAVILDAGFSRYSDIAQEAAASHWLTWPLQYPAAWMMPTQYDLVDVVANISPTPLLLIHGTQDQVIPYHHVEALYEAANKPKNRLRYDGPHIGTFNDEENQQLVVDFLDRVIAR
jgi:uncharacterized protein